MDRTCTTLALLTCLTLTACGEDAADSGPDAGLPAEATAFAVATDYVSAGVASTIQIPSLAVDQNVAAGVASTDPVVRYHDGKLYIINRFGHDNITILDADSHTLISQISTGPGSNPWDVAVIGTTLYVAALNEAGVVVLDEADPEAPRRVIDLGDLDPDGKPDCGSIYAVDDKLYVSCALLDEAFAPRGPGVVVVLFTADGPDGERGPQLSLSYANPSGRLERAPVDSPLEGDLLIATVPDYGAPAAGGCVDRIHPGAAPEVTGCLIENADLGGYASGYAYAAGKVWIAVSPSFTESRLVAFDMSGGLEQEAVTPATQQPTDVAVCPTGHLVVNDMAGGGLRVYGFDGDELTTEPLDLGQPPISSGGIVCY